MAFSHRNRDNKESRPRLKPEMSPLDWLLEIFALLILLCFLGYFIYHYPHLPRVIPSHFNASGDVDQHSQKTTLWMLPVISVLIYLLLFFISMLPHTFNYPGKITPQNAQRQYNLAVRLIRYLKMLIPALFFYTYHSIVRVACHKTGGLGPWFLPVFLTLIFFPIIIYLIAASRSK
jgi:uncharacterized membrane protein